MSTDLPRFSGPLSWTHCPLCEKSLVAAPISEPIKQYCEPGAFHSALIGELHPVTLELEWWKCPHCFALYRASNSS